MSGVARATTRRHVLVSGLSLALVWGAAACAVVDDPASDGDAPNLAVTTGALLVDTMLVHFTVRGDGLVNTSLGAQVPNAGTSASVAFTRVPEGVKFVYAWGLGRSDAHPEHPDNPVSLWRLMEDGSSDFFRVTSHQRHAVQIATNPGGPGNQLVGVDRYLLNPNYTFDAADTFAGSPDGSNVTALYIDGPTDPTCQNAQIVRDSALLPENSVGLFAELPAIWPDPDTWTDNITIDLDANRLGRIYVVAMPQAVGHDVTFEVFGGPPAVGGCSFFGEAFVRLTGYGGIAGSAE